MQVLMKVHARAKKIIEPRSPLGLVSVIKDQWATHVHGTLSSRSQPNDGRNIACDARTIEHQMERGIGNYVRLIHSEAFMWPKTSVKSLVASVAGTTSDPSRQTTLIHYYWAAKHDNCEITLPQKQADKTI